MSTPSPPPVRWLWPSRIAGALCIAMGLSMPVLYVLYRSQQARPTPEQSRAPALRPSMMRLPAGPFLMGSPAQDEDAEQDEKPQHRVTLSQPFFISATEVTQGQYAAVMGTNPSHFVEGAQATSRPVEGVSWFDAVAYCNRLSQREGREPCYQIDGEHVTWPKGLACTGYRLPTEAEWEYAVRAERATRYAGSDNVAEVAWHGGNAESTTHPVATRRPNSWGLYDMSGNVWEWGWDEYARYDAREQTNPSGPLGVGAYRVLRGGSYVHGAVYARVAGRFRNRPSSSVRNIGFRLARSSP